MLIVTDIVAMPAVHRRQLLAGLARLLIPTLLAGMAVTAWLWPIHFFGHAFEVLVAPMPILMPVAGCVAKIVPMEGALANALTGIVMTLTYGICLLVPLAIAYATLVLVTPRKPLVLYLRKFGLSSANDAISAAARRGVGRSFRLVTLDDSRFLPIDVDARVRFTARLMFPLVIVTGLGISIAIFLYGLSRWGLYSISLDGIGGIGLGIAAIGLVILVELLVPFSGLVLMLASIVQHFRRVRRQGKARVASTTDLAQIKDRWRLMASRALSPGVMAPRAAVVTTDDAIWQPTVHAGIATASAIVMDLSKPTENILWELEQVLAPSAPPVAFIGDEIALRTWADAAAENRSSVTSRFHQLLQGRTILAYRTQSRRDLALFSQSLQSHLGNLISTLPKSPPSGAWAPLAAALKRSVRATIPLWVGLALGFWIVATLIFTGLKALSA